MAFAAVTLVVLTLGIIALGLTLAVIGARNRHWPLLILGVTLTVFFGGFLGIDAYLVIACAIGVGCV